MRRELKLDFPAKQEWVHDCSTAAPVPSLETKPLRSLGARKDKAGVCSQEQLQGFPWKGLSALSENENGKRKGRRRRTSKQKNSFHLVCKQTFLTGSFDCRCETHGLPKSCHFTTENLIKLKRSKVPKFSPLCCSDLHRVE